MQRLDAATLALSEVDFARTIVDSLHKSFGVDLMPIFQEPTIAANEKRKMAGAKLYDAILSKAATEGYLSDWDDASPDLATENAAAERMLKATVDIEPNFAINPDDLATIKGYRGARIKDYVYTLTKRFENASKSKTPGEFALELLIGGVVSVGVPMAVLTAQAYKVAGTAILTAVKAGVTGIGMKTAIGAAVFVLVAFLLFLFLENPKKVLGMIINDTDENLTVKDWREGLTGKKKGDLYMAHGDMKSFMLDHENGLSSPEVQVRARLDFGKDDPDSFVFAGLYFADKKFGLRGAEGVFALKASRSGKRIAHFFACPYTNDNGTTMDIIGNATPDSVFRRLYDARKVTMATIKEGYYLQSSVNDARGGVVACISYIRKG